MKTNTNLVLNHIFWRGLYFFSIFLLNIGIARFFAAEKSGHLFFIINNLALILLIASICLESGATYYIASGKLDAYQMAWFCGIWALFASCMALTVWWVILYFTKSGYLSEPGFLPASFLFIAGVLLSTFFTALFYSKREFVLPNKILFLINVLLVGLLIAGQSQDLIKFYFIRIYFTCFFLQGILLMLFFFLKEKTTGESRLPSGTILKQVLQYSLAALLANGIYFLVNRIDYWFVQYYCSAKDLGNYIQASKLAQMLFIIPGILASTLFPIFSSREKSENKMQLTAVIRVLFLLNGGICVGIICFGWWLIPFLFGSTFNNMYLLFVLLVPGVLCVTMNYPMAAWFSAGKRIGINIRGSILALAVICAGDLILLPNYGIMAAPAVSSAGFLSYYCYTVYVYRKENAVSWKDLLLIRKSDINHILRTIRYKTPEPVPENPFD